MASWTVLSRSALQTRHWGKRLGKLTEPGDIIGLVGELGAGKTTFVRGMAEGLGVGRHAWVRSPSFTLINEYLGRFPVYHIDLYRVESRAELESLNLREYLFADGVSVLEWFDHLPAGEVDEYLELWISPQGRTNRQLTFTGRGDRYRNLVERLRHDGAALKRPQERGVER